eukprot:TRINITY_DN3000_c0_g3_i2.p1 TRINITY_DN3000_c0_g3~~TRINITY_DN3000_c0_g3_i2.p1  ORF type:complete len:237 (+),score=73.57 TRINITY_DN3000_c0_g3_i2:61-771(+)
MENTFCDSDHSPVYIPLVCPLTGTKIRNPVRAPGSDTFGCFDKESFALSGRYTCPLTGRYCLVTELVTDDAMASILAATPDDANFALVNTHDGSLVSYLREPSDPRVRELNTALQKAREDAQFWHDLAHTATTETDALKDRFDEQQKECDQWRARAVKGGDAGRAMGDAIGRAEGAEQSLSLYEDRVERAESKLLTEVELRKDAERQLQELRKQLDDIQRSLVNTQAEPPAPIPTQ